MKERQRQKRCRRSAPVASTSSSANSAWQRSTLGYKERFVDDFVYSNVRVRQFPSRSVFERAVCNDAFGSSYYAADYHNLNNGTSYYDPVPETAFTVWESSVLLGMYARRKDVWKRLIGTKRKLQQSSSRRPIVTLELGAGTGVASLLVATSEVVGEMRKCDDCHVVIEIIMTDLPSTINFTRLNVYENIDKIPKNVTVVTQPLRWGSIDDIKALPLPQAHRPDIIFGSDLLYTCDESVIRALAETVIQLDGRVTVFAVCKQHRPESLIVQAGSFEIRHVPASTVQIDDNLLVSDEDFSIIEIWRKKRLRRQKRHTLS